MYKVIIGLFVAVLLVGGGVTLLLPDSTDNPDNNENLIQSDSPSSVGTNANEFTATAVDGAYVEYSEEAFASAAGTDRIVFFHAEWCSTCKFFESDIMKTGVPQGVTVLEVDYDTNQELKDKYNVTVQSTFVLLDETGEVVRTWPFASGLKSAQDLFDAVASEA